MDTNGLSAMLAHTARVKDDVMFTRSVIQSYTFATYGKVIKYSNGRVDVQCGSLKFTNVEVLVLGVNGWGIKPVPAVGDRVLLISSQAPVIDIEKFSADGSMPPYDVSGLKAIPVTDENKALQLITVDKDKVEITGDNKLLMNADGVQFEDVNKNKVTTSDSGVAFEDLNGNQVVTGDKSVAISATIGDNKTSSVVMDSNGITITDAANSNKIEMKANDGVIINNKLQIK